MKKFNLLSFALLGSIFMYATSNPVINQESNLSSSYTKVFERSDITVMETKIEDVIENPTNGEEPKTTPTVSNSYLVNELNTSGEAQSYPWLSNDGLRVYYTHDKFIYVAYRSGVGSKFSTGKSVFTNINETIISGWLSQDELNIYFTTQSSKLYKATRKSLNENFNTYTEIKLTNAPSGSLFDASFTPDMEELLMYNNDNVERIVKFTRVNEGEYKFVDEVNVLSKETPTGGQLSRDGLRFYVPFKRAVEGNTDYRYIYVLTRKNMHDNFNGIDQVKVANPINVTAYQPTINADETQMIFVTGSDNLWDNNDLCEVALVQEVTVAKVPVKQVDPAAVINPNKVDPAKVVDPVKVNPVIPVIKENVTVTTPTDQQVKIDMRIAPNPFSEQTTIEINAPEGGYMVVQAFSMDGQMVATLYDGQCEKGVNIINWLKNGLSNGVYTVKATVGKNTTTKKVVTCNGTN